MSIIGSVTGGGYRAKFFAPLVNSIQAVYQGGGAMSSSRTGTPYVIDWEGLYKKVIASEIRFQGARRVYNQLTFSELLSNATWIKQAGATVTQISGEEWEIDLTACANNIGVYHSATVTGIGPSGFAVMACDIKYAVAAGNNTIGFKDPTGVDGTLNSGSPASNIITLTDQWQRFSFLYGNTTTDRARALWFQKQTGGANVIRIRRPQGEVVTGQSNQNPSEYVSNGVLSAPFFGASVDGVRYFLTQNGNTVSGGIVTSGIGTTLSPVGVKHETASTNIALWCRDMTNAAWVATTMTPTLDATGIDGMPLSASTLTATGAGATLLQTVTLASSRRIFSTFIKRKTGTGTISLTTDGGTTWTDVTAQVNSSTWSQPAINQAAVTNPVFGFKLGTNGDAIYVDFAQNEGAVGGTETQALGTSPIYTTTTSVARGTDQVAVTNASQVNLNGSQGTMYIEFTTNAVLTIGSRWLFLDFSAAENLQVSTANAILQFSKTTSSAQVTAIISSSIAANTSYKIAMSWGPAGMMTSINGTTGGGNVNATGYTPNSSFLVGHSTQPSNYPRKNFMIWPTQLSQAALNSMTK